VHQLVTFDYKKLYTTTTTTTTITITKKESLTAQEVSTEQMASPEISAFYKGRLCGWFAFVGARGSSDVHFDPSNKEWTYVASSRIRAGGVSIDVCVLKEAFVRLVCFRRGARQQRCALRSKQQGVELTSHDLSPVHVASPVIFASCEMQLNC
jgi:hypothetical protein